MVVTNMNIPVKETRMIMINAMVFIGKSLEDAPIIKNNLD